MSGGELVLLFAERGRKRHTEVLKHDFHCSHNSSSTHAPAWFRDTFSGYLCGSFSCPLGKNMKQEVGLNSHGYSPCMPMRRNGERSRLHFAPGPLT